MPKLKLIMLLNSSSDDLCDYYPAIPSKSTINQMQEIASRFKSSLGGGIIYTQTKYKYYYSHYNSSLKSPIINDDHLLIFLVADRKYNTQKIEELVKEIKNNLNQNSYQNFRMNRETKSKIVQLFKKFRRDEEKKLNLNDDSFKENDDELFAQSDMISKEPQSLDLTEDPSTIDIHGGLSISQDNTIMTNKNKENEDIKNKHEKEKVDLWRKEKILYIIVVTIIIFLILVVFPLTYCLLLSHNKINNIFK